MKYSIDMKTHFENGSSCLDVLHECGGTIQSTGWVRNEVLGGVTLSEQWFCTKCNKEIKELRQIKKSW